MECFPPPVHSPVGLDNLPLSLASIYSRRMIFLADIVDKKESSVAIRMNERMAPEIKRDIWEVRGANEIYMGERREYQAVA